MKKHVLTPVSVCMLFVLFFACVAFFVDFASANVMPLPELPPPIIIRSDGSIDPSTAPLTRVGSTYLFTGDINNTVEVQCSNIVLDGNGFVLTKPSINAQSLMMPIGWLPGVHVNGVTNVTVTNIAFKGCVTGVTVEKTSSDVTIINNTMSENYRSIVVFSAAYVNIVNNDITLTEQSSASAMHFLPSSPEKNTPTNIRIEANSIVGTGKETPTLALQPEEYGIWGDFLESEIINNNFSRIRGIALYNIGANNQLVGNSFIDNYRGIFINQDSSVNNSIYGNNFINNAENAAVGLIKPLMNFWDNGTVGNYWSDYNGADTDGDGIGDTPYILETTYTDHEQNRNVTVEEGRDNHPAMKPFSIYATSEPTQQTVVPPDLFSAVWVTVAVVAAAVIVGAGLIVIFKKCVRAGVSGCS